VSAGFPGTAAEALPVDAAAAALVGRARIPGRGDRVVTVRDGLVLDLGDALPTTVDLFEADDPVGMLRGLDGPPLGTVDELLASTPPESRAAGPAALLAPIDLQVVKAAGVTFPVSMLERVIEERAGGDPARAAGIRAEMTAALGGADLASLVPGSPEAASLKEYLIERGLWSQYWEVGIGPDAEIFTKAPVLGAVGTAVDVGVLSTSTWNNPEPEVVLVVDSRGRILGATLGNDVNLRDVEGRSALLLPKAKDNNASAALGPFVRLFDDAFGLDDVREAVVTLTVDGPEGFRLEDSVALARISRDPVDLVRQAIGPHHQYPDGFVLYLGTLFAPVVDRGEAGRGFTHHVGDVVRIASPRLGTLVNRVGHSEDLPRWEYGIRALLAQLGARGEEHA
jgi:fumarylacetoacetate (FAA) hydrolase family protein